MPVNQKALVFLPVCIYKSYVYPILEEKILKFLGLWKRRRRRIKKIRKKERYD